MFNFQTYFFRCVARFARFLRMIFSVVIMYLYMVALDSCAMLFFPFEINQLVYLKVYIQSAQISDVMYKLEPFCLKKNCNSSSLLDNTGSKNKRVTVLYFFCFLLFARLSKVDILSCQYNTCMGELDGCFRLCFPSNKFEICREQQAQADLMSSCRPVTEVNPLLVRYFNPLFF